MIIERYFNVDGFDVKDFAVPPKYPDHPDVRFQAANHTFSTPRDVGEFFGSVMR